jgi:hypothetical protein
MRGDDLERTGDGVADTDAGALHRGGSRSAAGGPRRRQQLIGEKGDLALERGRSAHVVVDRSLILLGAQSAQAPDVGPAGARIEDG